jgi:hypothetical protein
MLNFGKRSGKSKFALVEMLRLKYTAHLAADQANAYIKQTAFFLFRSKKLLKIITGPVAIA